MAGYSWNAPCKCNSLNPITLIVFAMKYAIQIIRTKLMDCKRLRDSRQSVNRNCTTFVRCRFESSRADSDVLRHSMSQSMCVCVIK